MQDGDAAAAELERLFRNTWASLRKQNPAAAILLQEQPEQAPAESRGRQWQQQQQQQTDAQSSREQQPAAGVAVEQPAAMQTLAALGLGATLGMQQQLQLLAGLAQQLQLQHSLSAMLAEAAAAAGCEVCSSSPSKILSADSCMMLMASWNAGSSSSCLATSFSIASLCR